MIDKLYKIRSFDESTGQIIISVEGYHSLIAIDLSLDENNNVPTGEDLHRYINGFVPYSWIERTEKLKNGIANKQSILDLVEPLPTSEAQPEPEIIKPTIEDIQSELEILQQQLNEIKNSA
jgi:hypothetical protein